MLTVTGVMLKHYCETGMMLREWDLQRRVLSESGLSVRDKVRMAINRLAHVHRKDPDRARFLEAWRETPPSGRRSASEPRA